jgi:hypothetical protein
MVVLYIVQERFVCKEKLGDLNIFYLEII